MERNAVRKIMSSAVTLAAVIAITGAASGCASLHSVSSTASPAASAPKGSATAGAGTRTAKARARAGSSIELSGNDPGEKMDVTLTKVWPDARPATSFDGAPSGDRLYAAQFRLTDNGSAAYSDAPSNGTVVVGADGQSYQSALDNAAECTSFPGTENITSGSSGLGCVVFEVPATAKIVSVQFTLDSGMGPQTGQWDVRT